MNSIIPIKKLFRIAVYTSTAIGLITIGPVYMVAVTMANVKTTVDVLVKILGGAVIGISFFIFFIWLINIALLYYSRKKVFLFRKKNMRYLWSYLLCFIPLISIRLLVSPVINDPVRLQKSIEWKSKIIGINPTDFNYMPFTNWMFQILIMIFVIASVNSMVLIIQDLVLLIEKKTKIENENIELKIKNVEAANQKLKQQLQPHFLFNSLNVLKTLIKKQPDNAETYLKRLSDFLRASVLYDNVNTVKCEEELKLSLDYIEMQKIRFGNALHFEVNIPDEVKAGFLPVFSVQMLLENAIKHNAFTTESPLHIKLFHENGWITVSNTMQHKSAGESSTGTGLVNLSERYKIISGNDIAIRSDGAAFSVSIKILSDENCNH
ncbi:MAG: sensor histidine kinase [Bacteroidales bacterium]|nr:sensor histidine kinase [Bacteroidales bacterium]